ncbi:MAG: P-loop NTPase [archaeon]|nr:P-loop NTPase [archaeon]MCP8314306.1 P-loop NTPase [archaeon]MCP8318186.1 P-loop NTPase [archaeon]MCP8319679.1 P-loop NTPase [archaeon]
MFEPDIGLDFRDEMIKRRFERIDQTILITSGKGGVGKSMVAATMAALMAKAGMSVGLLDADVYGPSSAFIFGVRSLPREDRHGLVPPVSNGVKVMSLDLFIAGRPLPMSGRGARQIIKEVLALTDWGTLDCLIVDTPPGTGDVLMTLIKTIGDRSGSIVVTLPTALSKSVVRRVIEILLATQIPLFGVLENMSYIANSKARPLGHGEGKSLALEFGLKFLGELPIDYKAAEAADAGDVQSLLQTDFARTLLILLKKSNLLTAKFKN